MVTPEWQIYVVRMSRVVTGSYKHENSDNKIGISNKSKRTTVTADIFALPFFFKYTMFHRVML